ncbi:hypothetical protein BJ912DRAFT_936007 [Pholiota molesta]|nr:hypothetical protein BJ912DRAFT_936007 [Pholiota molesta]
MPTLNERKGQNLVGNEPEDDRGHDTLASSLQQSNKRQPARSSIRRPSKRQRKGKGKATMRFLDVEAAPGDSSEDESTEESESHEENGNNTVYRRDIMINERDLVNTETTNEQIGKLCWNARKDGESKPINRDDTWYSDEVILRVRATEFLWEIQCTPGKEETFCDKIRKQSTDSSSTSSRPNYIYGHKDLPGRIYVEMNTHLEAVNFAQSYADLYSSGMKRVPSDTMLHGNATEVGHQEHTRIWAIISAQMGMKWKFIQENIWEILDGSWKTSDEDVTIVNTRNETEITVLRSQTRFTAPLVPLRSDPATPTLDGPFNANCFFGMTFRDGHRECSTCIHIDLLPNISWNPIAKHLPHSYACQSDLGIFTSMGPILAGVEGNMIVVRDKMKTRTVSLESISWLRPDNLNDMVVPIVGNLEGDNSRSSSLKGISVLFIQSANDYVNGSTIRFYPAMISRAYIQENGHNIAIKRCPNIR